MLLQPFLEFLRDKRHMLSTKVFVNYEILKYWIEKKHIFFNLVQKYFSGVEFDPRPYKKTVFSSKKKFWVIFSYKNLIYWFLRAYCEISAHTDVPNNFSILSCLFAMNWNPVVPFLHTNPISFACLVTFGINYTFNYILFNWHTITNLHIFVLGTYGIKHNYAYPSILFPHDPIFFLHNPRL